MQIPFGLTVVAILSADLPVCCTGPIFDPPHARAPRCGGNWGISTNDCFPSRATSKAFALSFPGSAWECRGLPALTADWRRSLRGSVSQAGAWEQETRGVLVPKCFAALRATSTHEPVPAH